MRKYILMNLAIAGLSGIFNGPVLSARDALKWARRWWNGMIRHADRSNKERLVRADSILRRQKSGDISKWDAAAEFDALLDNCGDLHFYSDTTTLRADWDQDVMLFPAPVPKGWEPPQPLTPSNTGIVTRGPRRGTIVTYPSDSASDCDMRVMEHFQELAREAKR